MDARRKGGHIGGLGHAGLDQLGVAGNAGQRSLQLVADVGGKLPAHRLVILPQFAVGLDGAREGDQFFIGNVRLDGIQVFSQMVDGLHQAAGQPPGQHRRGQQDDRHRAAEQRQGVGAQAPDIGHVLAHTQHLGTFRGDDAAGVVVGLLLHGLAFAGRAGTAVGHSRDELRAVGMAGQVGGIHGVDLAVLVIDHARGGLAVIQHSAAAIN